jgi:hypothetical protein
VLGFSLYELRLTGSPLTATSNWKILSGLDDMKVRKVGTVVIGRTKLKYSRNREREGGGGEKNGSFNEAVSL